MCPFFEKKEKSIVFSLHISTKISTKKPSKLFCQPRPTPPPIFPTLPINNNYCNVQPPPPPPIISTPPIIRDSRVSSL